MTLRTSFKSIQSRVVQQETEKSTVPAFMFNKYRYRAASKVRHYAALIYAARATCRRGPTALGVAARRNSAGAPTARESWPASIALT